MYSAVHLFSAQPQKCKLATDSQCVLSSDLWRAHDSEEPREQFKLHRQETLQAEGTYNNADTKGMAGLEAQD